MKKIAKAMSKRTPQPHSGLELVGRPATLSAPVLMSRSARGSGPARMNRTANGITICHREYFADIVGPASASFAASSYPVNPGVGTLFPWLSSIATQFEKYRFRSLRFEYLARCATSNAGTLILAVDMDASDPIPATKSQVCSYRSFLDIVPWESASFNVPTADLNRICYVRGGNISGTDIKLYDVANLMICTQGCATAALGEAFVEYDVELLTPQASVPTGGRVTGTTGTTAAMPFGTVYVASGVLPFIVSNDSTNSILTFTQAWEGLLSFQLIGTVITAAALANVATYPVANINVTIPFVVNAAGTNADVGWAVRASTGTRLTFIATATTITLSRVWGTSSGYDSTAV
jgi:hypothetical protein